MLLLTALIWGSAFVAQKVGMNSVQPFTFVAARMLLGSFILIPVILFMDIKTKKSLPEKTFKVFKFTCKDILGGVLCGFILFLSSSLQQFGLALYGDNEAAAGKAGFLTALYIVIVPILGIFLKKKVGFSVWISVVIASVGMYLLCVTDSFTVDPADGLLLLCSLSFSAHIMVIDYFAPKTDGVKLSAIQFFTAGVLGTVATAFFETPTVDGLLGAAIPILYAGMLSCAVAYTLQVVAQRYTKPTVAAVIMSLESVFAAITGALFGEVLSTRELFGCLLVFIAVILAQVEPPKIKRV